MKKIVVAGVVLFALIAGAYYSVYHGFILLNNPSHRKYPIRGVDVSHYQGEIDWSILEQERIDFVFIKATEGSSHIDPRWEENLNKALNTKLYIGAYHFFSFDSSGQKQAEHIIKHIPKKEGMIIPAIDVEFYGGNQKNPPEAETVRKELNVLLNCLENYYGKKPILYATKKSYECYLNKGYEAYPLWIRDIIKKPNIKDREWDFWQYSNRGRLSGYTGEERFIDLNIYRKDRESMEGLLIE